MQIHMVNTSGSVVWDVLNGHYGFTAGHMMAEIEGLWSNLNDELQREGVEYSKLKNALVPQTTKYQAAFCFDVQSISNSFYGGVAHEAILTALPKSGLYSVLSGDMIEHNVGQHEIRKQLKHQLVRGNEYTYSHSTNVYVVYVSNLSNESLCSMHADLLKLPAYMGYIDTRYMSFLKILLAYSLVNNYLFFKGTAIIPREDGSNPSTAKSETWLPFKKFSLKIATVEEMNYSTFLAYRIERPLLEKEIATEFELGSISRNSSGLFGTKVVIEDEKLGYLKSEKAGVLANAGLSNISSHELAELIKGRLRDNFIFNLRINEHSTILFNIIIEIKNESGNCHRLLVALEYIDKTQEVRLVTLF